MRGDIKGRIYQRHDNIFLLETRTKSYRNHRKKSMYRYNGTANWIEQCNIFRISKV